MYSQFICVILIYILTEMRLPLFDGRSLYRVPNIFNNIQNILNSQKNFAQTSTHISIYFEEDV